LQYHDIFITISGQVKHYGNLMGTLWQYQSPPTGLTYGELMDDPPTQRSLPASGSAFGDQGYGAASWMIGFEFKATQECDSKMRIIEKAFRIIHAGYFWSYVFDAQSSSHPFIHRTTWGSITR
jgi:hypothetical protein